MTASHFNSFSSGFPSVLDAIVLLGRLLWIRKCSFSDWLGRVTSRGDDCDYLQLLWVNFGQFVFEGGPNLQHLWRIPSFLRQKWWRSPYDSKDGRKGTRNRTKMTETRKLEDIRWWLRNHFQIRFLNRRNERSCTGNSCGTNELDTKYWIRRRNYSVACKSVESRRTTRRRWRTLRYLNLCKCINESQVGIKVARMNEIRVN